MKERIVDLIYNFFVGSNDFNGIPLRSVSEKLCIDYVESIDYIKELVREGYLSIQSSTNPHIIARRHWRVEDQLVWLEDAKNTKATYKKIAGFTFTFEDNEFSICVYPSPSLLSKKRNLDSFSYSVYSKELALGEPQLKPIFFDVDVLERYYTDPRFHFSFEDYSGKISCTYDEEYKPNVRKEDDVFIETFGIGFDNKGNRVAVVYLRYLHNLTGAHQIYWKSKECVEPCRVLKEYHMNTILGEWTNSYSIFTAFLGEIQCINELSNLVFEKSLFRNSYSDQERPKEFTMFFIPTLRNYNDFIHLLDKMLSENINKDFFKDQIELTDCRRHGADLIKEQKGTLRLLEEWLTAKYNAKDPSIIAQIVKPFKDVRKKRQVPAHQVSENLYNLQYVNMQKELMQEVYQSLKGLRYIFSNHPKTKSYVVPEWLEEGEILNL